MRTKLFLSTMLLFCLLPGSALAQQLLKNGGFESATPQSCPDHWSCSGNAWAAGAGIWTDFPQVITPHSGNSMVVMAPGGFGSAHISQDVTFAGYSLATLSFWWRYEALDWDVPDNGRDAFLVEILDQSENNPDWRVIWTSPINVDPSDGVVVSPWMFATISGEVANISEVTFRFRLRNDGAEGEALGPGDNPPFAYGQQTSAFMDDVSLEAAVSVADFLGKITANVQFLWDSGVLNKGQANSLSVKLDAAIRTVDQINTNAAAGQLKAFINEVTAMERSGRLSSAQSQSLATPASFAIEYLKQ